jgi:cell fate (sporulation/competence/biofilm development) regulator YmcA (YheA/YmcA/DUF963 family)
MEYNPSIKILLKIQSNPKQLSSASIRFENTTIQTVVNELNRLQKEGLIFATLEKDESNEIVSLSELELSPRWLRYLNSMINN